jgi:hypothetical protein
MHSGQSMPLAWVALALQHSSKLHHELPQTICQMEAGPVKFQRLQQ